MKKCKSANYDFKKKAPENPMGKGSFANLPNKPMFIPLEGASYRDGIMNNPSYGVDVQSKVDENGC